MNDPDVKMRCPACRANQPRQPDCRRCGADLRLLVGLHDRVDRLLDELQHCDQRGDVVAAETICDELRLIDPKTFA